ncbi:DUF624 domain-containing protein [Balamuthia mandrillaris]
MSDTEEYGASAFLPPFPSAPPSSKQQVEEEEREPAFVHGKVPPNEPFDDEELGGGGALGSGGADHLSAPMFEEVNYDLDILLWIKNGWRMYKEHWQYYTLFELLLWGLMLLSNIPDMAGEELWFLFPLDFAYLLVLPLQYGYFIVGSQLLRHYSSTGRFDEDTYTYRFKDMFRGFYLFFPLLLLSLLLGVSVGVGLLLFIVPGLYLLVTLAFAPYVYIEYHHMNNTGVASNSFGVIDSLVISRRVVHRNFCTNLLFFIVYFLVCLAGALCFGVGLLVARPVMELAMVFAFHDQFKLLPRRDVDRTCFYCW